MSEKRGLAYGHHSPNDLAVMQGKVKWWYNWGTTPEAAVKNNYTDYQFEYVPMTWGATFNENDLRNFLNNHPEVKYLLGFNEPNFASQANMTPQQVADLWPRLEAIADDYNLKLVAPAVNYSPGDVDIPGTDDDWSPWEYLDAFFEACEGCRVDYIAVHCYMKYSGAFEWFIGEFEQKYNLPIWVTEWANWDDGGPQNVGEQMDYLASTVRWMEANPNVYRYSWFIGRSDGGPTAFPYIDVLDGDGELSPLGGLYTAIPATNYRYGVPRKMEAEGAHRQSAFTHQTAADTDGYVNLTGSTDAWADYEIQVPTAGTYEFNFRLASAATNAKLDVLINNTTRFSLDTLHTGGAQTWQTFTSQAALTAGEHTMRVRVASGSVSINWLEILQR